MKSSIMVDPIDIVIETQSIEYPTPGQYVNGYAEYSPELDKTIFIDTKSNPFLVSTNLDDHLQNKVPLNIVGTLNFRGPRPIEKLFVVWSKKQKEFLVMANLHRYVYKSSNGIEWTTHLAKEYNLGHLIYANKMECYFAITGIYNKEILSYSLDGIAWIDTEIKVNNYKSIAYDDDKGVLAVVPKYSNPGPDILIIEDINKEPIQYDAPSLNGNTSVDAPIVKGSILSLTNIEYGGKKYFCFIYNNLHIKIHLIDISDLSNIVYSSIPNPMPRLAISDIISIKHPKLLYLKIDMYTVLLRDNAVESIDKSINIINPKDIGLNGLFSNSYETKASYYRFLDPSL